MANMSTIEHHGQLFSLVAPEQITNHAVKSAKPIRILRFELNNATRGLTATLTTNVITGLVPEAPLQVSVEGYTDALHADVFLTMAVTLLIAMMDLHSKLLAIS